MMNIDQQLLKDAIAKWGDRKQLAMVEEECMELAIELHKLDHREPKPGFMDKIVDEVADVNIMIAQANIMLGEDIIQERIDFKLNRLRQRLNDNEF